MLNLEQRAAIRIGLVAVLSSPLSKARFLATHGPIEYLHWAIVDQCDEDSPFGVVPQMCMGELAIESFVEASTVQQAREAVWASVHRA